jgi:hypothetical protein
MKRSNKKNLQKEAGKKGGSVRMPRKKEKRINRMETRRKKKKNSFPSRLPRRAAQRA